MRFNKEHPGGANPFSTLPDVDAPIPSDKTTARASAVPKKYKETATDVALLKDIHEFRRRGLVGLLGEHQLRNLGPSVFMSDTTLQRFVDCAREHKIRDLTDLQRETKWVRGLEFGDEVLQILHR